MRELRIAVIGAGSTYTPELITGFIERCDRLRVGSFVFCDTDADRNEILAGLARRMLKRAGMNAEIVLCEDYRQAVRGADYVIAQVRIGKMPARVKDERIPMRYGLLGQETTGLGGLSCALRTVPFIRAVAQEMKTACPDAWLINFSNPSGLVAEAVLGAVDAKMIGLCNIPVKMASEASALLGGAPADCEFVGLNHLCWLTGVYSGGEERLSQILAMPLEQSGLNNIPDMKYTPGQLRAIGGFPCGYLNYYYFREEMVKQCLDEEKTRGEVCLELERRLLELYADPDTDRPPELLSERGGAMYSEAAVSLLQDIENDSGKTHVVNVQNGGVLPFLRPTDVAELKCRITRGGAEPLRLRGEPGEHVIGMIQAVKAYERLAARAALTGDYNAALAAVMTHPLTGGSPRAKDALDELLLAHREYLPQFEEAFRENGIG